MITYVFPPRGGTPWDDLEEDRPWFDEALEADRLQDRERVWAANPPSAADVVGERFGDVDQAARELYRPPPEEVTPWPVVRAALLDDDIIRYRRRKTLNQALKDVPSTYRRGNNHARTPNRRDLAG